MTVKKERTRSHIFWRKHLCLQRNQVFCEKQSNFWRVLTQGDIIECISFFVDKQYLTEVKNACSWSSRFFVVLEIIRKMKIPGFYKRTSFVYQISQKLRACVLKIYQALFIYIESGTFDDVFLSWSSSKYDFFLKNSWFLCNSQHFR